VNVDKKFALNRNAKEIVRELSKNLVAVILK
jgi:hypothetical protein